MSQFTDEVNSHMPQDLGSRIDYLYQMLESDGVSPMEKQWIRRRIQLTRELLTDPTPRQSLVGSRRGVLPTDDQERVSVLTHIRNAKSILMERHVR